MIVDLNQLEYKKAFDVIAWCAKNNIDTDKVMELMDAWCGARRDEETVWELDIPEKYVTMFILKWM